MRRRRLGRGPRRVEGRAGTGGLMWWWWIDHSQHGRRQAAVEAVEDDGRDGGTFGLPRSCSKRQTQSLSLRRWWTGQTEQRADAVVDR